MRRFALTLALAMWATAVSAEPMTPAMFRDQIARVIAAKTGASTAAIDDKTFKATTSDGAESTISIDYVYAQYLVRPEALSEITERFADTLAHSSPTKDATIEQLVVIVRPTDYISRSVAPGASLENFVAPRSWAGDLSYFLAVDSPTAIRSLAPSDLKRWKIDEAAAWKRAVTNVKLRIGPISMIRLGDESGPSGIAAASGLAPSIYADPALCSIASPNGMGGQIVLLHDRDTMLFAMPNDPEGLARFWKTVETSIKEGLSISKTPITCKNGRWEIVPRP